MAVHAQYPSNPLLFLNSRSEQDQGKEMDCSQPTLTPPLFFINGSSVNGNQRKRGRESSLAPSIPSPALISLAQLQNQQTSSGTSPPMVSTGLKLSFEEHSNLQAQVQQEITSIINNQNREIEHYLITQGEQLRRTLAERRQRHYRALLGAAEEAAARRLKEKDLELDRAVRQTAELEDRIARLQAESLTWQAKATWGQAAAASLQAQIQQAGARGAERRPEEAVGESGPDDAESAHVDPDRVEEVTGRGSACPCRVCGVSAVSVVVLPCRHLCLCLACDAADAVCCPVCHAVRAGSVQVFFS